MDHARNTGEHQGNPPAVVPAGRADASPVPAAQQSVGPGRPRSLVYTFRDLGLVFQLSSDTAIRNRLKALASLGFPLRLPGGEARWSKPQVDDWFRYGGINTVIKPAGDPEKSRAVRNKTYGVGA